METRRGAGGRRSRCGSASRRRSSTTSRSARGTKPMPGRRDADPERFRAAALLSQMAGLGATFHYDGGLQAVVPAGPQAACFEAWRSAWELLPRAPITGFRELKPSDPITLTPAPASAWIGQAGSGLWVLAIGTSGPVRATAGAGWQARGEPRVAVVGAPGPQTSANEVAAGSNPAKQRSLRKPGRERFSVCPA